MARKVTGGRKKKSKNKSGKTFEEPAEVKKAPHTFIIHRGLSCESFIYFDHINFNYQQNPPFQAPSLSPSRATSAK